jgi:hypothetical protein
MLKLYIKYKTDLNSTPQDLSINMLYPNIKQNFFYIPNELVKANTKWNKFVSGDIQNETTNASAFSNGVQILKQSGGVSAIHVDPKILKNIDILVNSFFVIGMPVVLGRKGGYYLYKYSWTSNKTNTNLDMANNKIIIIVDLELIRDILPLKIYYTSNLNSTPVELSTQKFHPKTPRLNNFNIPVIAPLPKGTRWTTFTNLDTLKMLIQETKNKLNLKELEYILKNINVNTIISDNIELLLSKLLITNMPVDIRQNMKYYLINWNWNNKYSIELSSNKMSDPRHFIKINLEMDFLNKEPTIMNKARYKCKSASFSNIFKSKTQKQRDKPPALVLDTPNKLLRNPLLHRPIRGTRKNRNYGNYRSYGNSRNYGNYP